MFGNRKENKDLNDDSELDKIEKYLAHYLI